jgi:uncharacterized protein (TIGR02246 family)
MSDEVQALYGRLLDAWNRRDAKGMAAVFVEDGEMIGFDGSRVQGRTEIVGHLDPIFADHPTASFVARVKNIRSLGPGVALLRAAAGMIPPGGSDINQELNAHQSLLAQEVDGEWFAVLFQNTPAQFHGRPDLVEAFTEELRTPTF